MIEGLQQNELVQCTRGELKIHQDQLCARHCYKGMHSGDPSLTLVKDYTNQRKNTTVPSAMTARDSAKAAYVCDQEPGRELQKS